MMLMGYWSCAVQPGTAMTAHGDDEVRRHKGCRTFLLRPRARRPSDPELPPRRSKSTYTLSHPPETARRQCVPGLREGVGQRVARQWSGGGAPAPVPFGSLG